MYKSLYSAILVLGSFSSAAALDAPLDKPLIGAVNFTTCVADSKCGKKEQENFENLRKQMSNLIENTEKELKEIASKFEDTEYLDSLSPKAEEELKLKFQTLQEDLNRYQSQFYQVMNHTHYQMMQKMNGHIASAAEKVAKTKKLDYIVNRELCFYIRPDLDITTLVVAELDKSYEIDAKTKTLSNNDEMHPEVNDASFDQAE